MNAKQLTTIGVVRCVEGIPASGIKSPWHRSVLSTSNLRGLSKQDHGDLSSVQNSKIKGSRRAKQSCEGLEYKYRAFPRTRTQQTHASQSDHQAAKLPFPSLQGRTLKFRAKAAHLSININQVGAEATIISHFSRLQYVFLLVVKNKLSGEGRSYLLTLKLYFFGIRNDKDNANNAPKLEALDFLVLCFRLGS